MYWKTNNSVWTFHIIRSIEKCKRSARNCSHIFKLLNCYISRWSICYVISSCVSFNQFHTKIQLIYQQWGPKEGIKPITKTVSEKASLQHIFHICYLFWNMQCILFPSFILFTTMFWITHMSYTNRISLYYYYCNSVYNYYLQILDGYLYRPVV